MSFPIYHSRARSILSTTSGFIREAGFTHSLTPARNCTFGCTYCYVPTLNVYGGLQREDWERWGQFTTYKENAAQLLARELRPDQIIYCSPLVDPYQPAEEVEQMMPALLRVVREQPPRRFVIQTRGPLILRDADLLRQLPGVRVSFSVTTDREDIRRLYEPHCAPIPERLETIRALNDLGIPTYATLAPLLPCNPESLAAMAAAVTPWPLIGDPLHIRSQKRNGATTRPAAQRIAEVQGHAEWFTQSFQDEIVQRITRCAPGFTTGPSGFAALSAL